MLLVDFCHSAAVAAAGECRVAAMSCRISTPSSSLTNRAGSTRTLASLCSRASRATSGVQATAARTPGCRLAAYAMPRPVPQSSTPRRPRGARPAPPRRGRNRDSRPTPYRWCPGRAARTRARWSSATSRALSSTPAWSDPMGMTSGIWYLMYKNWRQGGGGGRRRRRGRHEDGEVDRTSAVPRSPCHSDPLRPLRPSPPIHIRSSPATAAIRSSASRSAAR